MSSIKCNLTPSILDNVTIKNEILINPDNHLKSCTDFKTTLSLEDLPENNILTDLKSPSIQTKDKHNAKFE